MQFDWCPYAKRELWTWRRMPCEVRQKEWNKKPTRNATRMASKNKKPGERLLRASSRNHPTNMLILDITPEPLERKFLLL